MVFKVTVSNISIADVLTTNSATAYHNYILIISDAQKIKS